MSSNADGTPGNTVPWRCFFGFHRWPKWSDVKMGQFGVMGVPFPARQEYQDRKCPDCNLSEWRIA